MRHNAPVDSREDLAALLARQIADGDLQPGDLLPSERVLSERHGLSRSMVREALRTVSERRLIDTLPGRGSRVRETTVNDAVERLIAVFDHTRVTPRSLIEARSMIETTTTAMAAERATDADLDAIRRAHHQCHHAGSVVDRVRWDIAFHFAIVRAARNPLVEPMFHAIQPYIVELLFRSFTDEEVTRRGLAYHQPIIDAIAAGDAEAAAREMASHLTLGLTLFGDDIDRNLSIVARSALERLTPDSVTFEELMRLARET